MTPNSYKLIKFDGFISIPPDIQLAAIIFALVSTTIILLVKDIS